MVCIRLILCQIFELGTVGHMFAQELEIMITPYISKPLDVLKSYIRSRPTQLWTWKINYFETSSLLRLLNTEIRRSFINDFFSVSRIRSASSPGRATCA